MSRQSIDLRITFVQETNAAGQITKSISVDGPALADKFMAYMMLESARDAIKDHHDKLNASLIERVPVKLFP